MRYVRHEMSTYTGKRRLTSFNQRFPKGIRHPYPNLNLTRNFSQTSLLRFTGENRELALSFMRGLIPPEEEPSRIYAPSHGSGRFPYRTSTIGAAIFPEPSGTYSPGRYTPDSAFRPDKSRRQKNVAVEWLKSPAMQSNRAWPAALSGLTLIQTVRPIILRLQPHVSHGLPAPMSGKTLSGKTI
jgi:hypothetical protein